MKIAAFRSDPAKDVRLGKVGPVPVNPDILQGRLPVGISCVRTVLVLVTDLYEGGDEKEMRKRMAFIVAGGVQLRSTTMGRRVMTSIMPNIWPRSGFPTFACTPDKFPDLMAAALSKQDIGMWASKNIKEK